MLALAGAWFFWHQTNLIDVDVTAPIRGPAVQAVYATGTVEATVMIPIAAQNTARLVEINADEGDIVKKDQVLAKLEDDNLQKSLEELQARESFARKNYERRSILAKQGYETKSTLDQARSEWDAAKAAVARANVEAGFMKLLAPADGKVIKRDGEIGQTIPMNTTVFWLSCCAPLRVSAEVDEEDISAVKDGQEVLIRSDAFPEKIFHGKVSGITPKGDPVTRSYRVRIQFSEETPLQIGMTAETNIIIRTHQDALLVPNSAVTKNNTVWLVQEGRLTEKKVVTGAQGAEKTEIISGIAIEDRIVTNPAPEMKAGQGIQSKFAAQVP